MKKHNLGLIERLDKIISGGLSKQIMALLKITGGVIVIFAVLSLIFPVDITFDGQEVSGIFSRIPGLLYHFLDPGNISDASSPGAQAFVTIFAITGMILLGGLLITTLTNIVERRIANIEEGKVVYKSMKDHYIIIGYGDVTISIIRTLLETSEPQNPIVILTSQDIKMVRMKLFAQLPAIYESRIYFYSGNIDSYEHIKNLNVDLAKEVYILGEKNEYGRDSKNLECVKTITQLRGEGKPILTVNVQFDKLTSYSTIQKISLSDEFLTSNKERTIYFRPFNFFENWARMMWGYTGRISHKYDKLDFEEMTGDKYVHLVIVGFTRMGRALLLEALRQCHYPNFIERDENGKPRNKTRISVVDNNMEKLKPEFLAQYPYLDQIKDIDIEYLDANIQDPEIRTMLINQAKDENALLTIAISLEDPDISLSTGLCLPDEVFYSIKDNQIVPSNTRVLIRQALIQEGIGRLLESDNAKYSKVHIFGMTDKGLCKELMNDDFAMYINAYYVICYYDHNNPNENESLVNEYKQYVEAVVSTSPALSNNTFIDWVTMKEHHQFMHNIAQRMWLLLNEDMRFSNRYQVDMYDTYAKYIDSPALMQMEHLRWNADRSIVGYLSARESGIKNTTYKIHKSLVPFCELTDKEQIKDLDVILNMKKLYKS